MSTTLNKKITSMFFATDGGYDEMRRRWKAAVNDPEVRATLTSSHYALYTILSGKSLAKAFTPVTNEVKLTNGAKPYYGAFIAVLRMWNSAFGAQYSPNDKVWGMFSDLLTPEAVTLIHHLCPVICVYRGDLSYHAEVVATAEVA